jgi:hypothetical protein
MSEPAASPPPPSAPVEPATGPFGRPVALFAVCLVNFILGVFPLVNLLRGPIPAPPPQTGMPPFPDWFRPFAIGQSAALILAVAGLWLMKRWGFGLLALAYMSMVGALVAAHQVWVCAAAVQFPLFAIASRQWKYLK